MKNLTKTLEMPVKTYNYGVDILRMLAMVLVVTVHATTFNGFTSQKADNITTFLSQCHDIFHISAFPCS